MIYMDYITKMVILHRYVKLREVISEQQMICRPCFAFKSLVGSPLSAVQPAAEQHLSHVVRHVETIRYLGQETRGSWPRFIEYSHASVYSRICAYVCMHACMYVSIYPSIHPCIHVCVIMCVYGQKTSIFTWVMEIFIDRYLDTRIAKVTHGLIGANCLLAIYAYLSYKKWCRQPWFN